MVSVRMILQSSQLQQNTQNYFPSSALYAEEDYSQGCFFFFFFRLFNRTTALSTWNSLFCSTSLNIYSKWSKTAKNKSSNFFVLRRRTKTACLSVSGLIQTAVLLVTFKMSPTPHKKSCFSHLNTHTQTHVLCVSWSLLDRIHRSTLRAHSLKISHHPVHWASPFSGDVVVIPPLSNVLHILHTSILSF